MLSSILQKFRTWFDLVWFHYAKSLKEIRFQKRIKGKNKKKERQPLGRPGNQLAQISPEPAQQGKSQPRPDKQTESVCFISLSLTDGWGPHVSTTFNLRLYSSLQTAALISPFISHYSPAPSVTRPRL
jgi:hypothetical protein